MTEIITADINPTNNRFKKLYKRLNKIDKFYKLSFVSLLLLLIATPIIVNNRFDIRQRADSGSGILLEAESGQVSDNMSVVADSSVLGGQYIEFGKHTSPSPTISLPPTTSTSGIWLSREEIMALPMNGAAWERVKAAANSNWGSACLYDNNCMHDVNTLAGALVAVRTNDAALKAKVIAGLQSAMNSNLSRTLELSRGFQTYVIAADIIAYRDPAFMSWVRSSVTQEVTGHTGGVGILGTAKKSANNWGGHARASLAAAAIYLNDPTWKQDVVTAHKAFIGMPVQSELGYTDTNWHADPNNKAGINRKGTVIQGRNVSGVHPEDWRRATNYKWPPDITGYMWEGMQGFVVTAVILERAKLLPITSGDNAVIRSMDILYGRGETATNSPLFTNPAAADDTWIPWVVNRYLGTNYPTQPATNPGKNMGWTDWTHAQ